MHKKTGSKPAAILAVPGSEHKVNNMASKSQNQDDYYKSLTHSEYTDHLQPSQKQRYIDKLTRFNIRDPYLVPQVVFTALNQAEVLPDLQWPDIYNYLIQFPSVFTGKSLKAYKSMEAKKWVESGWVIKRQVWQLTTKKHFIAVAQVRH